MIAIIDDNATFRNTLERVIRNYSDGIAVRQFDSPEAYFSKPVDPRLRLIAMDIYMPGMDGFEATRRIGVSQPDLPVVIVTTQVTENIRQLAETCGAMGCIQKDMIVIELPKFLDKYNLCPST